MSKLLMEKMASSDFRYFSDYASLHGMNDAKGNPKN